MPSRIRAVQISLALLALAYVIGQFGALVREGINWDEFVFLSRAEVTIRTNVLQGGGRPGLGVAALIPFVRGCDSPMQVALATRALWIVITTLLLGGVFELTRRITRRTSYPWHAAALATALLALVPLFLRWSIQVRTDQPAVAVALWAGIALLASRDRPWLGVVAGVLLGLGYLFSQKALYIGGLVGIVALGDHYIDRAWVWRREIVRTALFAAGGAVVLGAYKLGVARAFSHAKEMSLDEGLDLLQFYRSVLHFRIYGNLVWSVLPHLGLGVLMIVATLRAIRGDTAQRRPLTVALAVLLLGIAVARFHAASFPYFWITLGVFPAVAIGLGWQGIYDLLARAAIPVTALAWIALVSLGIRYRSETLADTQSIQRDSLAFTEHALPSTAHGFQADGALFCRRDGVQLPVYLGQNIMTRFTGVEGPTHIHDFIAEHRKRPILFIVWTQRLAQFPPDITRFWRDHYVPYAAAVYVAGAPIAKTTQNIDVILAGGYRWWGRGPLSIAGMTLRTGDRVMLPVGSVPVTATDSGILAWAVDAPPSPSETLFHDDMMVGELTGSRRSWW